MIINISYIYYIWQYIHHIISAIFRSAEDEARKIIPSSVQGYKLGWAKLNGLFSSAKVKIK